MNVRALPRWFQYLVVLLVLAALSFAAGNLVVERSSVKAQPPAEPAVADGSAFCITTEIAVLNNRIHVRCQTGIWGSNPAIVFFAAGTNTPEEARLANRYLALLTAAEALNIHPYIYWADSPILNPPSCNTADCRRLVGVVLP